MTDPKIQVTPEGGGSYVRLPDGSLKQVEKPTAAAATSQDATPAKPAKKEK